MTTAFSNSFRTQRSGISAQDLIKLQNSVVKNGVLRPRKKLHLGRWPHRFVVLTHDSLYIYVDETSKSPRSTIALLGYNRVARCEVKGQDWCFSIIPSFNMQSMKTKTIACSSDVERKSWMQAIKNQIYVANNISRPKLTILDKIKLMTGETNDDDYDTIEQSVFGSGSHGTGEDEDLHIDDHDYDSSGESDHETDLHMYKKTSRSMSVPHTSTQTSDFKNLKHASRNRTLTEHVSDSKSSDCETCEDIYDSVDTTQECTKRAPSDAQPKLPLDSSSPPTESIPRPASDPVQMPPPRYSEVYREEPAYVNLATMSKAFNDSTELTVKPSLESLCTVTDIQTDRQQLIDLLLETNNPGTYLIRKSRSDNNKVLAVLDTDGQVKEYKLFGTADKVTIDQKTHFACVDELLEYYTSVEHLPNAAGFLVNGIYQITADGGINPLAVGNQKE